MKRLWILVITLLFFGCATFQPTPEVEKRMTILEERVDEMEMVVAAGTGAYFRPFSGGLDGSGSGVLQKVTGTNDGDVGLVVLEGYTGAADEGPLSTAAVGNIWFMHVVNTGASPDCSPDDWPKTGRTGDNIANECWEYAGLYQVKTEFIPIGWAIDGWLPPDNITTISRARIIETTRFNSVKVRKFDGVIDPAQDVHINWAVPSDFLTGYGKIKFRVITMVTESQPPLSTEGWSFFLRGASIGTDDILGADLGIAVESNITGVSYSQYDIVYTGWSSELTVTDLVPGEFGLFAFCRGNSDADDDYEQDIGVIGIEIMYPAKMTAAW